MKQILNTRFLLGLLLGFFLQACENETDWDYQTGDNGKLVVEAILTNEQKIQELHLSLSYDNLNGAPTPVSDAVVSINTGQNEVPFIVSPDIPGKYVIPQPAAAIMGVRYQLKIEWNGQSYTAESEMVGVWPMPGIQFQRVGQSNLLKINNPPDIYSTLEQAMYEVDIDWSHLSSNEPNRAKQIFYVFTTIDVNEIFKPEPQDVFFPKGSIVTVKKYGLNDDFAAYLRALASETEWQGGVLDEASSSLPSNISNGGLGFFGVCAVRVDTVIAM